MKKLVWFAVAVCAMFAMNQAAGEEGRIYYSVESTVSVDGRVVMKPTAIALADNPVRTEIDGNDASSTSYRFEYTVTPVAGKEKSQATIHVSFFDMSKGNWVLRSQPSAVVRLDQEATIALPYHEGPASSRVTTFNITVSRVAVAEKA